MCVCIHLSFCCVDQGMDGEAMSLAYTTISGPDCLKDIISKYGIRLKVYQAIKDALFVKVFIFEIL